MIITSLRSNLIRSAAAAAVLGASVLTSLVACGGTGAEQPSSPAPPAPPAPAVPSAVAARPASIAPPEGAAVGVGALPSDVDLVLVVENAAELRGSPVGGAVGSFLGDAGVLAQTEAAWAALARQLGWTQDEAFDRLLGGRVVLLFRAGGAARAMGAALLSDVSNETDASLKGKLEVAPRKIDNGHPILLVEKGLFELTSHRRGVGGGRHGARAAWGAVGAGERPVTLVLGPAGKGELFDDMVRVLDRGAAASLEGSDALKAACGAGKSEVLLILRPGPTGRALAAAAGAGADRAPAPKPKAGREPRGWDDFLVIAGRRTGDDGRSWTSRVVLRDRVRREALRDVAVTSDAPFRALAAGSLLAIVQSGSLEGVFGKEFALGDLLAMMPMPEAARPHISGRQASALHRVPVAGDPAAGVQAAGGVGQAGGAKGRVACTVAMETTDAPALAKSMDGAIARFVQTVEQRFGAVRPPPRDFAGSAPGVARVLPVELPEDGPQRLLTSDPVVLSWAYPSVGGVAGDVGAEDGRAAGAAAKSGWWVLSAMAVANGDAASPSEAVRAGSRALLTGPESGRPGRWVWLGRARPAEIESLLPALVPDVNNVRSALRRFEDVALRLSITERGEIQGDLDVKLAAKAPKPAADERRR